MHDETSRGIRPFDLQAPTSHFPDAWESVLARQLTMPTGFDYAKARRESEERKAQAERLHAEALDEWRQYADRHYANRILRAVFDIHQPVVEYDRVTCQECKESDCDDTVGVEWPRPTYAAMKEAADG